MKRPYEPAKAELLIVVGKLLNDFVLNSVEKDDGSQDLPEDEFFN